MKTEPLFSGGGCALDSRETRIKGWQHIYRLACMEGSLMAIAARQRLSGGINDSDSNQIAFIAFDFVREQYADRSAMSAGCASLADAVEQLALHIDRSGWCWAISLETGAIAKENHNQKHDELSSPYIGHLREKGRDYRSLPLQGDAIDASVYVPVTFTEVSNFEIVELGNRRRLAVVASLKTARQIACYAVSLDGGYGDLIIRETSDKPTSQDFTAWFLS